MLSNIGISAVLTKVHTVLTKVHTVLTKVQRDYDSGYFVDFLVGQQRILNIRY